MEEVESQARQRGQSEFRLSVFSDSPGVRFYKRLGFAISHRSAIARARQDSRQVKVDELSLRGAESGRWRLAAPTPHWFRLSGGG